MHNLENVHALFEILVWPLVVVILGLIFKKSIERLIDRTTKVSKSGLVAANKPQEAVESPKASNVNEFLKKTFDNALLVELEDILKKQVDALNPTSHEERERLLMKLLASILILSIFDSTYYLIYGSQITALQHLNNFRGDNIPTTELKLFYDAAKNVDPQFYRNYSFDSWLKFLESSLLIKYEGKNVAITIRGKEFLKYLVDQGYTFLKKG